ncbi:MAG TPA: glycosyltransferase family 39 protein, partial [Phycisphaerae bacterium]|nr:glycosyltransferase family 39 protein [Phycisphaerae bacterium]
RLAAAAAILLAACAVAHVIATRLSWTGIPLQTDTGMWAYIGGRILDGALMYRDLWESKPPGIYYTFAIIERLFGRGTDTAFLWLDAVLSLAVLAVTYAVARRFASRLAAAGAILLLSLVFCHRILADWGDNVEKFVALFEMIACYLVLRSFDAKRGWLLWLLAGVSCGFAGLFKQTGILFLVAASLTTLWLGIRARERVQTILGRIALLIAGAVLPWLPVTICLVTADTFTGFWQQAVAYDLVRVGSSEVEQSRLRSPEHWATVLETLKLAAVLFTPALLGAVLSLLRRRAPKQAAPARTFDPDRGIKFVLVYWLLATAVFPLAPYGYGHYLLQAAPPAAVLVARALSRSRDRTGNAGWTIAALLLVALGLLPLGDHFRFTFDRDYQYRKAYVQLRRQCDRLTDIVRQQSTPSTSVMLWPPDYTVSYYAQRLTPLESSNSDVIFKGKIGRLRPPMPELLARLAATPPDVIVDTTPLLISPPARAQGRNELTVQTPPGSLPLAASPGNDRATPEDRILAPLRAWVHQNYGGQQYLDPAVLYYRGRPWRPWEEVFRAPK